MNPIQTVTVLFLALSSPSQAIINGQTVPEGVFNFFAGFSIENEQFAYSCGGARIIPNWVSDIIFAIFVFFAQSF